MRIARIYTMQELGEGLLIALEPQASHYVARVLRLTTGDPIVLFNGDGGEYLGKIASIEKKMVRVSTRTFSAENYESPLSIHLGIAVSRGERMDWVVQKSTELGVSAITPLLTARTGVKLTADRNKKKRQHWQKIALSACEQCGRNLVPAVYPPQTLDSWLASTDADRKFVLHHRLADHTDISTNPATLALLIGPEGGLTAQEIKSAEDAGYAAMQLGPRVLRTETAPLAAIALMQSWWGDIGPK